MAEEDVETPESDVMSIFDTHDEGSLVCRVCGSLVSARGQYPGAHYDWHEASSGA